MPIIPYSSPPVSLTTSHLSHLISSIPINVFTITHSFYISIPINPFRLSHTHCHLSLSTPHHVSILLSILPHEFPLFIYPLNLCPLVCMAMHGQPLQMSPPFLSIPHVPLCPSPFLTCMESQVHGHLYFFPHTHFSHIFYPSYSPSHHLPILPSCFIKPTTISISIL